MIMPDETTLVPVSPHLVAHLERLSAHSGRSVASYVEEALLSSLEDFIDAHDADVVMENIKAGREVTRSLDDVERDLGLRDKDD
ncbi:putative DNA-binding protein with an HTH domain protein [Novosphingobium resinovorum]|uniref:Putative DNA-binding protein with an HTH domain protein n=2 Tax=Novosphingobium resinovorum TaxID=158500 RepID=A0A031JXH2_9SPHN|nr:putative DNA-binding protein with an HTH domain protein [Novosphingobium resinovorum]